MPADTSFDDLLFGNSDFKARQSAAEQERNDLAAVLASPEGFRLLVRLLKRDCGLGSYLSGNAEHLALYNFGESLLRSACEADPANALRLLAAIRNIEI